LDSGERNRNERTLDRNEQRSALAALKQSFRKSRRSTASISSSAGPFNISGGGGTMNNPNMRNSNRGGSLGSGSGSVMRQGSGVGSSHSGSGGSGGSQNLMQRGSGHYMNQHHHLLDPVQERSQESSPSRVPPDRQGRRKLKILITLRLAAAVY
jgi:hypothetical protein